MGVNRINNSCPLNCLQNIVPFLGYEFTTLEMEAELEVKRYYYLKFTAFQA